MDFAGLFGALGVMANVLWPLLRTRRFLLLGQIAACVLMASHFALLAAYTGAAVMLLAGLQAALAMPLETHPRFKAIYLVFLLFTPLVCWLTWQGLPSVFSSLALALFCLGNLQLNTLRLRAFLLACLFAWVVHNALVFSLPALVSNGLALSTSLFAFMRERKAAATKPG